MMIYIFGEYAEVIDMKKTAFFILLIFTFAPLVAQSLSEGEKLFTKNEPVKAIEVLEKEIADGRNTTNAFNYLGLAYFQTENYEKSVEIFEKGIKTPGTSKKILSYNCGNSYFLLKNYEKAAEYFSYAYTADRNYYQAVLNRANSYLRLASYDKALLDYKLFLELAPDHEKSDDVRKMIAALEMEIIRLEEEAKIAAAEAERQRLEDERIAAEMAKLEEERKAAEEKRLAEEAARKAEEERIAAEKKAEEERIAAEKRAEEERLAAEKRAADAERRRKLLEEVAESLQNTDSANMSSGAESIIDYEMESELE
ncbi:MAG: tetratricopeptide repeat protein [Treponema sp.]|nr:tetratricopeptide repeat protein [Treponema sp.]